MSKGTLNDKYIPKDYEEAAYVDGAGYYRTMFNVILPLAKPSIITVILFNFLSFWNEYIISMTLLTKVELKTLPVGLMNLMAAQKSAVQYGQMYAGLVIVIVREDLLGNAREYTPTMLDYKVHADAGSLYNTPPCFTIYMCKLVLEWIKGFGGLEEMKAHNVKKAKILYDYLDSSKMFKGTVVPEDRSLMNIPFVTGDADLDAKFVKESTEAGFINLKGHKTVGGMRASVYNAMPIEGVEALVEFMKKFEEANS